MADAGPTTTVFSRRVEAGREAEYEEWLTGISQASAQAPGYQGTTVLRPSGDRKDYVAITHFESPAAMESWLGSERRKEWLDRLTAIGVEREKICSLAGLERWITLPEDPPTNTPPRYKTALLILIGLYPTSLLLGEALSPALGALPAALRLLVTQALTVPLMVYFVLPWVTRVFRGWLHPRKV